MLAKLLKNKFRVLTVLLLVIALAAIRAFENVIFYDPFLAYFKGEFSSRDLPDYNTFKLLLSTFFRYTANSVLSLLIIYVIFRQIDMIKFATLLYFAFFVILILLLFLFLSIENVSKMYIFYVRRFLVQPLFLLLFIPAFYFQSLQKSD